MTSRNTRSSLSIVYSIRQANLRDITAIMDLEYTLFGQQAWSVDIMKTELSSDDNVYFVIESAAGELIAYAGVKALVPEYDIHTLGVDKKFWGKGFGHIIMNEIDRVARELASQRSVLSSKFEELDLFLEVSVKNTAAIALYKKSGFRVGAERPRYYPDGSAAYTMIKKIPVEKLEAVENINTDKIQQPHKLGPVGSEVHSTASHIKEV